ncbi:MAG: phosphoenolpyruvate carboxylase [Desulfobacteraceae bacterium]|nr:phosphoenolpyruvate carboxylase [Desulfobacteraceae bacterium]
MMEKISDYAMQSYRKLSKLPAFSEWYGKISQSLGQLSDSFIFMQTRYHLSGWYGIGQGLESLMSENADNVSELRKMYASWSFFRELIDNAQRNMLQCRLAIAKCYSEGTDKRVHLQIAGEYEKALKAISEITGQKNLLEKEPLLRSSVCFRSPWIDALNLLQIEFLNRRRKASEDEETGPVHYAIALTMNGISAAMQSLS